VSAVHEASGDVAFFVGVAEDITEQREHDEARAADQERTERLLELEKGARARAERANRMRDDVLAVVAHDLRNPLHTLQLSAMSMAEPGMSDAYRARQAQLIGRAVENMDHLIGELLDIGRIEAGSFAVAPAPEDLGDLLDEALALFLPQAGERNVRLTCERSPESRIVSCDRDQLLRVLSNLIGNAMKFTPSGGEVRVHAQHTHTGVHISVRDTGPGIPAEDLAHVFDRFWQADRTRRFGTGLGLVIAKGIVESHGGRIWAESTVGDGSCFHFTVPTN
jgi:two-component system, chemotaxis family, sensor kinase Cph1